MKNKRKRFAFTLAEVLITLGIIGVVASITVPVLMQNIQDAQFKQAWKKEYSILSQATSQIAQDNGGTLKGICNNYDGSCIAIQFKKYLKITFYCLNNGTYSCFQLPYFLSGPVNTNLADDIKSASGNTIFTLIDGTNVLIRYHDSTCSQTNGNACGWIMVDVNGNKIPNKMGKDVYFISILENRILPYGAKGACKNGVDDCNSSDNGYSCSSLYLYQ